jgi:hypothetical protein
MDIVWLLIGAAFFGGSMVFVRFLNSLRAED